MDGMEALWVVEALELEHRLLPDAATRPLGAGCAPRPRKERQVDAQATEELVDQHGRALALSQDKVRVDRGQVLRFQLVDEKPVVCPGALRVVSDAPPPSAWLTIHPSMPSKVGRAFPHVGGDERWSGTVDQVLSELQKSLARPLAMGERFSKSRHAEGELVVPCATVTFEGPAEDAAVEHASLDHPLYVRACVLGARVRFQLDLFLPGELSAEEAAPLPTRNPQDTFFGPESCRRVPLATGGFGPSPTLGEQTPREEDSWQQVSLPGFEVRYSVLGLELSEQLVVTGGRTLAGGLGLPSPLATPVVLPGGFGVGAPGGIGSFSAAHTTLNGNSFGSTSAAAPRRGSTSFSPFEFGSTDAFNDVNKVDVPGEQCFGLAPAGFDAKSQDKDNPAFLADGFFDALRQWASGVARDCSQWAVLHLHAEPTDELRRAKCPTEPFVGPRFAPDGLPLSGMKLYSTAGLKRPGLDALLQKDPAGGVGRLSALRELRGVAAGGRGALPRSLGKNTFACAGGTDPLHCMSCGSTAVTECKTAATLSVVYALCARCREMPTPGLPQPTCVLDASLPGFEARDLGDTARVLHASRIGGSGDEVAGLLDPEPTPCERGRLRLAATTQVLAAGLEIDFGRSKVVEDAGRITQHVPRLGERRPSVAQVPVAATDTVTELNAALLQQELALALKLPSVQIVVAPLQDNAPVSVMVLARPVAQQLCGPRFAESEQALFERLTQQAEKLDVAAPRGSTPSGPPTAATREACAQQRVRAAMAQAGEDVQTAIVRFRADLEDPMSLLNHDPGRYGFFLLQGVRRAFLPDASGLPVLPRLPAGVAARDALVVGDPGPLDRLVQSTVACRLGCGQTFKRHDGSAATHERLRCPLRARST